MGVVVLQAVGIVGFLVAAVLGRRALEGDPTPEKAERISRFGHAAFYVGLIAPYVVGLLVPGAAALDGLTHMPPFPVPVVARLIVAVALMVPSGYFAFASNAGLAKRGKGTLAFKLTSDVVTERVYGMVRNPMALGFYLGCLGMAFLFGSTYLLVYAVAGLIPAHVFYLKFFEERELSVRYGTSYDAYREKTPFLIPRLYSAPR